MASLDWKSVNDSRSPKFFVKGTVLAAAFVPGTHYRFQIAAVRTLVPVDGPARYEHSERYSVRDAATVSDDEVRRGITAHQDAVAALPASKSAALDSDPRYSFSAFGTCSFETDQGPGHFNA